MANWSNTTAGDFDAEQAERTAVFNKIAPAGNWKMPIDAVIDEADLAECEQAAIWFTGGPIEVVWRHSMPGRVRVFGLGYYHHIGA